MNRLASSLRHLRALLRPEGDAPSLLGSPTLPTIRPPRHRFTRLALSVLVLAGLGGTLFTGCASPDSPAATPSASATPATGSPPAELTLTLASEVFGNTRSLRVLLPPGYHDAVHRDRRYPVFYFTDGIAAWHGWGVPEVAADLWRRGAIPPWIFVAIDNGGSTRESTDPMRDRAAEFLPYADPSWVENPPEPRGDRFPEFFFDEVKPRIDRELRTLRGAEHTGLAGSSYGGVAVLHTLYRHPGRIGRALIESPSLHVGEGRLLEEARRTRWPARVRLGVGTAEGDTPAVRRQMLDTVRELRTILEEASPAVSVSYVEADGAEHGYDAWRARLPEALVHLLADAPGREGGGGGSAP